MPEDISNFIIGEAYDLPCMGSKFIVRDSKYKTVCTVKSVDLQKGEIILSIDEWKTPDENT